MKRYRRIFVLFNPVAGTGDPDHARSRFEHFFNQEPYHYERYDTTGDESVADVAVDASNRGFDLVVAAGGDGTVSGVASGLIGRNTPLGIIPLGTANVLARELLIPINLDEACRLLVEDHSRTHLDAMKVGERYSILHLGIGIDSVTMRDMRREHKRRFGQLAYIVTGIPRLLGFQPRCFSITVDGSSRHFHAAEVQIANGNAVGVPFFQWGNEVRPDDGVIDVCIISARTLLDYFSIAWYMLIQQQKRSRRLRFLQASQRVVVETDKPLPVHMDGEVTGETPVEVQVIPGAVWLVVPPLDQGS